MTERAITFRPYTRADNASLIQLINEAFAADQRFTDPQSLDRFLELHLLAVIIRSSWTEVALLDDEPIGFIACSVPKQPRINGQALHALRIGSHFLQLIPSFYRNRKALKDWFEEQLAYIHSLRNAKKQHAVSDSELVLFFVGEQSRGTGVGTQLFSDFKSYLREIGGKDFFLYTDSDCTWQFYEAKGMQRGSDVRRTVSLGDNPRTIHNYVYIGTT